MHIPFPQLCISQRNLQSVLKEQQEPRLYLWPMLLAEKMWCCQGDVVTITRVEHLLYFYLKKHWLLSDSYLSKTYGNRGSSVDKVAQNIPINESASHTKYATAET